MSSNTGTPTTNDTLSEAALLKDDGVTVYVIGVSEQYDNLDFALIRDISSPPSSLDTTFWLYNHFADLGRHCKAVLY